MADSVEKIINDIELNAKRANLVRDLATQMALTAGDSLNPDSLNEMSSIVNQMSLEGVQHYSGKISDVTEPLSGEELQKSPEDIFVNFSSDIFVNFTRDGSFGHEDEFQFINKVTDVIRENKKNTAVEVDESESSFSHQLQTELARDYQEHATSMMRESSFSHQLQTELARDYQEHATSMMLAKDNAEINDTVATVSEPVPAQETGLSNEVAEKDIVKAPLTTSEILEKLDAEISAIQTQRKELAVQLDKLQGKMLNLDNEEVRLLEERTQLESPNNILDVDPIVPADECNESDTPPEKLDKQLPAQVIPEPSNKGAAAISIVSCAVVAAAMFGNQDIAVQAASYVSEGGTHLINQSSGMLSQAISASTDIASAAYGTTTAYGSDLLTQTNGLLDNVGTAYENAWSAAVTSVSAGIDNVGKGTMDLYSQASSLVSGAIENTTNIISETINNVQSNIAEDKHDLQVAGVSSLLTAILVGSYAAITASRKEDNNIQSAVKSTIASGKEDNNLQYAVKSTPACRM